MTADSPLSPAPAPTELPPPGDPDGLYILDISAFIFRAYHALPPLSNSKGEATGAVAGVTQMLLRLFEQHKPTRFIVAYDSPGPTLRKQSYPAYKANRPPAPADLKTQMGRVRELVTAWGLCGLEAPGYEADDLIASVVHMAEDHGLKTVILSGDKDLLQLVGPNVMMYDPMRERVFGVPETIEKMGVRPRRVGDLLALMGDCSDNIPGVPNVGQKTAAKLLAQYESFDGVFAHAHEVKGKLGERLREHRDLAVLSRKLVTLFDEVPIDLDEAQIRRVEPNAAALRPLFRELELSRLEARLGRPAVAESTAEVAILRDAVAVESWCRRARGAGRFALFVVVADESPLRSHAVGLAMALGTQQAAYVPLAHRALDSGDQPSPEGLAPLHALLADPEVKKLCGSLERDTVALARSGIALAGGDFDVSLASYLLAPGRRGHDLPDVAVAELDRSLPARESLSNPRRGVHLPLDELAPDQVQAYAGAHARAVWELEAVLAPRLVEGPLSVIFREMELPLAQVLIRLEMLGVRIDLPRFRKMEAEVQAELDSLVTRAYALAGRDFNLGSPKQLEEVLFDELGLPVLKKTKTSRTTNRDTLEDLLLHPDVPESARELLEVVLEHRTLAKLEGTYLSALPKLVDPGTSRLRTRYNQAVAATGRLSSSDPNLQNIPIRTELGRRIRAAFVPEPGWLMLAADYSQVELRVLAHLSGDQALVDAYSAGADVHARTATALFGVDEADVSRDQRAAAKTVNFAVIYGQSEFALSRNLRIPRAEAKRYIEAFFARYEGVARFMDEVVEQAKAHGYVETLFGRRRIIPDLNAKNWNLRGAAERVARNTPIQGTAADILKRAMVLADEALSKANLRARMLLTVHDELVFELPPEEREELSRLVSAAMRGAAELRVPLEVNLGVGESWGEAH